MPSVAPNPDITFAVEYQDEHLLVVNKRAGLVSQPGKGHEDDSLLNGLFAHHAAALQQLGTKRDFGLLHRLDRETSGLLVVALTANAYDALRDDFEQRRVQKFYYAVVAKPPKQPSGVIDKPIAESAPRDYTEKKLAKITTKTVRGGRSKPSQTAYRVVAVSDKGGGGAVVECRPLTGRLHQVRVHLASIGCPIFGDGLYASPAVASMSQRLALHAHRLAFTHPITGAVIDIHSPFPKDLRRLLTRLGLPRPDAP